MANDFSTDSRIKSVWKLDNGVLTTDSKGSNTLTNYGTVTNDTTNKKEGDASANCAGNYLGIADASLDAGMPLKQGDTVKKGTWCYWVRFTTVPGSSQYAETVSKWDWAGGLLSLENVVTNSQMRIGWGYSTGQTQITWDTFTVVVNRWYHVAVTFDGVARTCHVRVWDDTAGTATNYNKTNWGVDLRVSNCQYSIGPNNASFPCQVDEFVVANDQLSDAEIDLIRAGNYNSSHWYTHVDGVEVQTGWTPTPIIKVAGVEVQVAWNPVPGLVVGGANLKVAYLPIASMRLESLLAQAEVQIGPTGIYTQSLLAQLEYGELTNLILEVDTIPIEIVAPTVSLRITTPLDVVNIAIAALTMADPAFGVSVATENILITPHNVTLAQAVNMTTLAIEIALLTVTIELVAKRKFPLPPDNRQLQSQLNKRKFPLGH